MPHEKINHPRRNINDDVTIPDPSPDGNHTPPQPGEILNTEKVPKDQLVVSWNGIGWVQVSVYPEGWSSTGDAEHVELNPQELDLLIKTLRRAKRQAYGQGNRHSGFEDGPELTSRPLFKQKQYLDAELCGHDYPDEGDEIHVAGDPVDMICLASPLPDETD